MKLLPITGIILLGLMACAGASRPMSDHFDGSRFFNPAIGPINKPFTDLLKWKWNSQRKDWPEWIDEQKQTLQKIEPSHKAVITFINHATFLLQLPETNILFDPIWSERCSPLSWAGPKRHRSPGIEFSALPKIDVVMISHNHFDHMDTETLLRLESAHQPLFLVPLGDKEWLMSEGLKNVVEMDWWQTHQLKDTTFTFMPAQHWSARGLFDRNRSLWGSFGVETKAGHKIYHSGDSGLGDHFKEIQTRFGSPDVALIPIGAYEPRWFMKMAHMNPEDAIHAFHMLKPKQAFGMHFGTFQLTDEGVNEPIEELTRLAQNIPFHTLPFGGSYILK